MSVDVHAHIVPPEWTAAIRRDPERYGSRVGEAPDGTPWIQIGSGRKSSSVTELSDVPARLQAMDERGLDRQVLSPALSIAGYELDERPGQAIARLFNETAAEIVKQHPDRFIPVGTVPMPWPDRAVEELNYAVQSLGARMIEIASNVNGLNLDDERFQPFWRRAAELGVLVQVHPNSVAARERLKKYTLSNMIGNPMDTTIAAGSLIFGGVLERNPGLKVCLVHGGGAVPYLLGRWTHGHASVAEAHSVEESPATQARKLYFDTLVHDPRILTFLYEFAGPDQLMLGSDYPYDMGEADPIGELERAGLGDQTGILNDTAARILNLG